MYVLGLDVGTSSVKTAVLEVETGDAVSAIGRAPLHVERPTTDAAEICPSAIWKAVTAAAREALEQFHKGADSIVGVGMSVLTPGLILLDHDDRPLTSFVIHFDRRSRSIAQQVWREVGDEFLLTVGNLPLPGGVTVTSYRYLVESTPSLRDRIGRYLHVNGWLALKLTGNVGFDYGNASFTGLFNTLTDRHWSNRWCDYFGVDPNWLPPVMSGDATVGGLKADVAEQLGLSPGIPVKLGLPDTSSAVIFVGLTEGDLLHVVGTTQVLAKLCRAPRPRPELLTRMVGIGDRYLQVAHNPVGGVALEWLRELCFPDRSWEEFLNKDVSEALVRPTEVVLDPPYIGGDRVQMEKVSAAFRNLTLTTDRVDLLAALLRALREEHEKAIAMLVGTSPVHRLFLTGRGADVIRKLIPAYGSRHVEQFDEGSLRGCAKLFAT